VGNHHGRDAIFGFFGQLHQETAGTLRANMLSMAATGDQVFVRSEVTGQRLGNSLNADHVQIFTIADGQVTDVLLYSADHPAEAAFWSRIVPECESSQLNHEAVAGQPPRRLFLIALQVFVWRVSGLPPLDHRFWETPISTLPEI